MSAAAVDDIQNNYFDHHHRNPLKDSGPRASSFGASERRFLYSSQSGKSSSIFHGSSVQSSCVAVQSDPSIRTELQTKNPSEKKIGIMQAISVAIA